MGKFDKWAVLKITEVILVAACLIFKRVTDDEARSIFLYLQKLSREWSLLNNITWDRVGSSVADATYGGYLIITTALLIGKLAGELPTGKRITEWVLLGVGAVLFIVLGSLAFAAIDSVPQNLVDNAAILGTLSVVTGALFLLDMGAPKAKKKALPPAEIQEGQKNRTTTQSTTNETSAEQTTNGQPHQLANGQANGDRTRSRSITEQVYDIEREIERSERATHLDDLIREEEEERRKIKKELKNNGIRNGGPSSKVELAVKEPTTYSGRSYIHLDPTSRGYKQMKDEEFEVPRRFGIYGRDVVDYDTDETASIPPKIELHTPVWSNIRKEQAKKYNIPPIVPPQRGSDDDDSLEKGPSSPLDPGYVQYTAQHWGDSKRIGTKTPRHSPTEV